MILCLRYGACGWLKSYGACGYRQYIYALREQPKLRGLWILTVYLRLVRAAQTTGLVDIDGLFTPCASSSNYGTCGYRRSIYAFCEQLKLRGLWISTVYLRLARAAQTTGLVDIDGLFTPCASSSNYGACGYRRSIYAFCEQLKLRGLWISKVYLRLVRATQTTGLVDIDGLFTPCASRSNYGARGYRRSIYALREQLKLRGLWISTVYLRLVRAAQTTGLVDIEGLFTPSASNSNYGACGYRRSIYALREQLKLRGLWIAQTTGLVDIDGLFTPCASSSNYGACRYRRSIYALCEQLKLRGLWISTVYLRLARAAQTTGLVDIDGLFTPCASSSNYGACGYRRSIYALREQLKLRDLWISTVYLHLARAAQNRGLSCSRKV